MTRGRYDSDGWRDYDGACDEYRATVRESYNDEYDVILEILRDDETGEAWSTVAPLIRDLADHVADFSDTAFTSLEGADLIEAMIEGDL